MPELEYLRQQCNFVNLEKDVFELRAQGIPLERIAEELNISVDYARKLSQRVNKKIIRIL
jgi:orotate phosphoribosyltransferase-like protein